MLRYAISYNETAVLGQFYQGGIPWRRWGDRYHSHALCGFGKLGSLPGGHQLWSEMNISDFQHLTWYSHREGFFFLLILCSVSLETATESEYLLCEIQKCYFAVKIWHREASTQNQQPTAILQWCVQGKSQTRELTDCSVPKEPWCSLCHDGVSHQEERELNSQSGLPTETAQNAHGEKKNQNRILGCCGILT